MRTLNTLTQNLIENLTQLLQTPGEDALQSLKVCSPVLIEQLEQVLVRAVDRRDIESQLKLVLDEWFRQHPQPEAETSLIEALRRHALLPAKFVRAPA